MKMESKSLFWDSSVIHVVSLDCLLFDIIYFYYLFTAQRSVQGIKQKVDEGPGSNTKVNDSDVPYHLRRFVNARLLL